MKTVPELARVGDVLRTSYGCSPCYVRRLELRANGNYDIVLDYMHPRSSRKNTEHYPRVNNVVATADGRLVSGHDHLSDEYFIEPRPPEAPAIQIPLFHTRET